MSEQVERRGLYGGDFIRALTSAWECCATCAGGVLASHDRAIKAKGWDEGMRCGASRAMRKMSDEPDLPLATEDDNPYRTNPPAPEASAGVGEGVGS